MKWITRCPLGCALLVAFAAAACGSDSTAPEQVQLDQEASMEIMVELLDVVFEVGFDGAGAPAQGQPLRLAGDGIRPSFNTESIEITAPCEHGGSVGVAGTFTDDVDETTGSGSFSFNLTQTPQNCQVDTSHGMFVVNGSPHLVFGGEMTLIEGWPSTLSVTFTGGYTWSGEPGTGSCTMDLTLDMDFENPELATMSGTVCGHSV